MDDRGGSMRVVLVTDDAGYGDEVAAAGDALFSLLPLSLHSGKLLFELAVVAGLTCLNVRGVKESVMSLMPIFVLFLVTHTLLIVGADHGEELDDHGCWFDHHGLYDTNVRVPLLMRLPGQVPAGLAGRLQRAGRTASAGGRGAGQPGHPAGAHPVRHRARHRRGS